MPGLNHARIFTVSTPPGFHCIPSGLQGPTFEHEFECVARQQQRVCRDKSMPEYSLFTHLPGFHDIASGLRGLECGCVAWQ
ncbi:hypothetical protein [Celerinatantimonas sp. YJH-8]|uniref:hypothetical protein n=1 Tax=Celerinatantimonas sp. YJH-8 TaxID=3228714 RepID=UPI0038C45D2B